MEKPPAPVVGVAPGISSPSPSRLLVAFGLGLGLLVVSAAPARAHVNSGASCSNCHGTARNGMALTGFLTTTNAGAGLLKLFRVAPGETTTVGVKVTDGHNEYGLALVNLDAGGTQDTTHHLTYQVGAGWTKRSAYYSLGPKTANQAWTLALNVLPTTPPDVYLLRMRMAGDGGGRWAQEEAFYLEVVRPTPPTPSLSHPTHDGSTFACRVATTTGFTYYLESRESLEAGAWTVVSHVGGDGTTKVLSHSHAVAAHGVYRVRVD